ncbi:ATP-dependent DNA helicase RecG [Candidatus Daviesbacteria bacterium]|nr:ATP-dependent DNA helicase RecG [Candidatus Daviesbacteria bacterium]
MDLNSPLYTITGIGSSLTIKLKRLNLNIVGDLIYHFPFRYDDFSKIAPASEAQIGEVVTLRGEIWSIKNIYTRFGKVLTQAIFNDGTTSLQLTWFNQSWLAKQIQVGDKLQISGKLSKYKSKLSIMAPEWERLPMPGMGDVDISGLHTGRLVPVYPETAGLSSKWIRGKIAKILPDMLKKIIDPLPPSIQDNMLPLDQAISQIHLPKTWEQVEKARERLGFDELFFVSLATQRARLNWQKKPLVQEMKIDPVKLESFTQKLPFKLTSAQKRVLNEIITDLKSNRPMNRLIQGEVGSGKTVVAAIAIYLVHLNGLRSLLMAPTEILAFQHYATVSSLLQPFGIKVGIYTGSKKAARDCDVIIGTHALLSLKLATENVGLIIIDEQQRFGVEQRTYLRSRAKLPHFLTMTATPIPRTVALTLYGDLDLSIIDEMPKGRPKIKTYLVPERKRLDSYKFIEKKIREGDQTYIITPLIEESETLISVKAAKIEYQKLQKIFPNLKLGLLHGRMKANDKEEVLKDFRSNQIQILVSTSVVEVGMDIPNATIMVIEGAERFGLAQLHQLRGRIGRGTKTSYCLLYTSDASPERSRGVSSENSRRLKYLETTFDGLKLAELDLKIRGGGEIFGVKQSGRFEFKIASLSDLGLVEKTRQAAEQLLAQDPMLDKYPLIKARLEELASEVMPD